MYYVIIWSTHPKRAKEIEEELKYIWKEQVLAESFPLPSGPIGFLPESRPSVCMTDCEEGEKNPWIRLFRGQFPEIPFLTWEERKRIGELSLSGFGGVPLGRTQDFLDAMIQRRDVISPCEAYQMPPFEKYSFVCLIGELSEGAEECMEWLGTFHETYPWALSYAPKREGQVLFVLYDFTANFAALERARTRLIEKWGLRAGILHHGIGGMVSSFLESCQVHYMNRLIQECHCFEEISSATGVVLKDQKIMEVERSIRTDLQFREGRNVLRYLHQWFQECRNLNYTLEDLQYDSINLYSSIKYTLFDMYELKLKRIKAGREVHEILNIRSMEELEQWFYTWFLYTLDNFDLVHAGNKFRIQEVLQFIDNHILDDLSLSTVASYFYVNASYFSTLFRQKTGQTYISYVTKLKMKKAMELLKEDFKVYETAHMLGYEDIHHFRNVFKRYHGISPSQVKK